MKGAALGAFAMHRAATIVTIGLFIFAPAILFSRRMAAIAGGDWLIDGHPSVANLRFLLPIAKITVIERKTI